uniref:Uncharacterized protein n=1 Tax=Rhipicephalus zambeziensis TaxID=60191 RepID=A0A224YLQ9_9ACAR
MEQPQSDAVVAPVCVCQPCSFTLVCVRHHSVLKVRTHIVTTFRTLLHFFFFVRTWEGFAQTGSHKGRILAGEINRFSVVVYWMDMILLLLCCVPEMGVHSPSSRVQSGWAGHSDCHDLSCPAWYSSAPGEHRSQVRGSSGHCMCVAIGTPVTFFFFFLFWPVLSSTVTVCCVLQPSVPTESCHRNV